MVQAWISTLFCALLCACTTIDPSKDHVNALYFGAVRVVTPSVATNATAPVTALDTRVFGLRLQDGLGAGYFHDQRYEIPLDCRVVIFVQNQQQLDRLSDQIKGFKEGVCGTIKS